MNYPKDCPFRKFVYKHQWQNDDIVMWDNRCTMHCVEPYDNTTTRRIMHRVTIVGRGKTHSRVKWGKSID